MVVEAPTEFRYVGAVGGQADGPPARPAFAARRVTAATVPPQGCRASTATRPAPPARRYGGQPYFTCERLTMCPLQKKMIAKELLSQVWLAGCCLCPPAAAAPALTPTPCASPSLLVPHHKQKEVEWVDAYHAEVWEALSPRLQDAPEELEWLRAATSPL